MIHGDVENKTVVDAVTGTADADTTETTKWIRVIWHIGCLVMNYTIIHRQLNNVAMVNALNEYEKI